MDNMTQTINAGMLRHHTGQTMFCPFCKHCLDAAQAVSLDFNDAKTGVLAATYCVCVDCYDQRRESWEKVAPTKGYTLSVIDGREVFPARRKARKVVSK